MQLILNMLRLGPLADVMPAAREAGVSVIARVPLASGLLSGKYDEHSTFAANDHRNYNRGGEAFDIGETFSGVEFATGLEAVRRLAPLVPSGVAMAQFALRRIIDQPASASSSREPAIRSRPLIMPRPPPSHRCRTRHSSRYTRSTTS